MPLTHLRFVRHPLLIVPPSQDQLLVLVDGLVVGLDYGLVVDGQVVDDDRLVSQVSPIRSL